MKSIKKILFYADGAKLEKEALGRAVKLAKGLGACVQVVDVVAKVSTNDTNPAVIKAIDSLQQALIDQRMVVLKALVEEFEKDTEIEAEVVSGKEYVELIRMVSEQGYDLLIKAVNTPSLLSRTFFGEADLKLLRKCPCPVWIMKPSARSGLNKILVAVDPLDADHKHLNQAIVAYADYLAKADGGELTVMGCWSMPFDVSLETRLDQSKLDAIREGIVTQCEGNLTDLVQGLESGSCRVELKQGRADDLIPEFADRNQVDLVLMGTLARVGLPGIIIGNTAEKILHSIKSSVLALKPEGFGYPRVGRA